MRKVCAILLSAAVFLTVSGTTVSAAEH
ncbi:Ail/Lom family outer membrane beta-barrel protein, partial [Escherichia fergusonii]